MGINVTQTMNGYQFENRENLRNAAKDIFNRQGASDESTESIMGKTIFDYDAKSYSNAQLAILKASSQMSISNTLKETLKYLKSHPVKKTEKEPVLGELWNLFNEEAKGDPVIELEIDYSAKNIFAAA